MRVCSTDHVFHVLLNTGDEILSSILEHGLRPLSDFPESDRWRQFNEQMPGFFEDLYEMMARPILQLPYMNSGIFVSPIDFRKMPGSLLFARTRIKIPLSRIDPAFACLTYEIDGERVALPLTDHNLRETADLWTDDRVGEWFAKDRSKIFFYVPQIAVYQPGGIPVEAADIENFV
jgi:hypothetical protein